MNQLSKLNGLYIPGDSEKLLTDQRYIGVLKSIIDWAEEVNKQKKNHFPIFANSYGMLAFLRTFAGPHASYVQVVPGNYHINLFKKAEDTFIYDSPAEQTIREWMFDTRHMCEVSRGFTLKNFEKSRKLKENLLPIATLKGTDVIAMFEGKVFPFFGVMQRLDVHQFVFGEGVDHSSKARGHAQHLANFFVDEAKMSSNKFASKQEEDAAVIQKDKAIFLKGKEDAMNEVYVY